MLKFNKKIIIFSIPVLIFLVIPFVILTKTSEVNSNIDELNLDSQKYLIGYTYNEDNYKYLKYKRASEKRFDVMALGSSRVLQFRKEMFKTSFYNAGFTIKGLNDYKDFLKLIPKSKLPTYLIIGLDQWMFNASWDNLESNNFQREQFINNKSSKFSLGFTNYNLVYKDIFKKKITFSSLSTKKSSYIPVGLNARINSTGFRNDGSMYYGNQINKLLISDTSAEDYLYQDTFTRIENGNRRFEYANVINLKALEVLNELLSYCHQRNIKVVAILPPFADKVYDKMISSNNYNYIQEISPKITPIFKKYNFEVFQFNTVRICNSSDNETIDGFHGGEKTYLKMLIKILEKGSILNNSCDLEKLREDLNNSINNYLVYDY
ncbi:hypothetical protein JBL43_10000 [Aureibaculum sp. A20]|uniref:SGNH/GDSL hydrolase family protein n=1 Tax=Aureibaculum flavum TaxID=2795986 RepID=A0ABS0WRF6_9FLAO|nr:hypothetical protein [Aureibaculum flavum]MBJ2174570.1 hypothetical protein [Aureibaculum flavum]